METYSTVIRSAVMYGNETWRLTKRLEQRLTVFENGVPRRICGPVYDHHEQTWRRRRSEEICQLTKLPKLVDIVKAQRMKWAGHVARHNEKSVQRAVLEGIHHGTRPVGRPRKRWKDGVREDAGLVGLDGDEDGAKQRCLCIFLAAERGLHGPLPAE